ncbi:DUF2569 domain-containing protein [Shimwellia blattae]|uniref:Conserved inner membrane protein n=1 Tax=Shimwellia blattae (strain ATCC 29907 / DSM 4481 / JCM 1650 / NBRC 105725 / CDC 9005-74) TaxID=630626 RepID=I2BA02_SHIBC|nr:DUF2569 domain-containing protein [Shimwellia blattae]AFJ47356.1 conserved inner membrane protein [Shimwellia blattae DSM 4481 = NBRC 105725]GAB80451.1 hypothetical protein YdgK [Shimwellia blattae DSM 4481 = NBRC 105725]VDY64851.1 Inner membrane protein ydgK [Shimwellia blattae]VEC22980.1 Inner membrane protein ydgK [Shimwellia blattae]
MSTTSPARIGGWLLAPLAWLLMTLISTTLINIFYTRALFSAHSHQLLADQPAGQVMLWYLSLACAYAMWGYTLWLTVAFFKRRRTVPRHYIIWLLITVLLAVKSFAFAPVTDELAVRQLLFPLLAAAVLAPYFRHSARVKQTFTND